MFRPRVIPVLLLKGKGLVKTINFRKPTYIGDPINAVKIFNELEADELMFLDITATNENRLPSSEIIKQIADEAFMPFAVGGGINNLESAVQMISSGAEKVVLNSICINKPSLVSEIANRFGSQSVIVSVDVKKDIWNRTRIHTHSGKKKQKQGLIEYVKMLESLGAGELVITDIDYEGKMNGYNNELISEVSSALNIPVVANGGAWSLSHLKDGIDSGAHAVGAGSMFVYHGPRKGILVNYPTQQELMNNFAGL